MFIAFTDAINQMPGATFWSIMFFLMLLTLGLDSLFGALESVTTALQDVRGFGKLRREVLSGEHRVRSEPSFRRSLVDTKLSHMLSQVKLKQRVLILLMFCGNYHLRNLRTFCAFSSNDPMCSVN